MISGSDSGLTTTCGQGVAPLVVSEAEPGPTGIVGVVCAVNPAPAVLVSCPDTREAVITTDQATQACDPTVSVSSQTDTREVTDQSTQACTDEVDVVPVRFPVRKRMLRAYEQFKATVARFVLRHCICGMSEMLDIVEEQNAFDDAVNDVLMTGMIGSAKGVDALECVAVLESGVDGGVDVANWNGLIAEVTAGDITAPEGIPALEKLHKRSHALSQVRKVPGQRLPRFVAAAVLCLRERLGAPPLLVKTQENEQLVLREYLRLCRNRGIRTYDTILHLEDVVEGVFREWVVDPRRQYARVPAWVKEWLGGTISRGHTVMC